MQKLFPPPCSAQKRSAWSFSAVALTTVPSERTHYLVHLYVRKEMDTCSFHATISAPFP